MATLIKIHVIAIFISAMAVAMVEAQENEPALLIELNTAKTIGGACRLSFLIQNELPEDITKAVFETVLFDGAGAVNQLTLFDFGVLPSQRPRVRQFDVAGLACEDLGSILINGATACEAGNLPSDVCGQSLELNSRTDTKVIG